MNSDSELLQLAKAGDPEAQVDAGIMYFEGFIGDCADYEEAIKWFSKSFRYN